MGTAKYDHPGYVADTGADGKYHVGIWCPHGYPAHIHIGRPAERGDPQALLRLRIPDGVFQSLPDDPETCAAARWVRRWVRACCLPSRWTGNTRNCASRSTPNPGPARCSLPSTPESRRKKPTELPTATVDKPWDSLCAFRVFPVITMTC